jgi:hypothetical protein
MPYIAQLARQSERASPRQETEFLMRRLKIEGWDNERFLISRKSPRQTYSAIPGRDKQM